MDRHQKTIVNYVILELIMMKLVNRVVKNVQLELIIMKKEKLNYQIVNYV